MCDCCFSYGGLGLSRLAGVGSLFDRGAGAGLASAIFRGLADDSYLPGSDLSLDRVHDAGNESIALAGGVWLPAAFCLVARLDGRSLLGPCRTGS